jgi:hypothetical protein
MLERNSLKELTGALNVLEDNFDGLPPFQSSRLGDERISEVLKEVAERLGDNYPYFHPLYAGQMLKPPHPLARAVYALAT